MFLSCLSRPFEMREGHVSVHCLHISSNIAYHVFLAQALCDIEPSRHRDHASPVRCSYDIRNSQKHKSIEIILKRFMITSCQLHKAPNNGPFNIDGPVKSRKILFSVIPAKAGIQLYQWVPSCQDSGFHRSDDFLRNRQQWFLGFVEMR